MSKVKNVLTCPRLFSRTYTTSKRIIFGAKGYPINDERKVTSIFTTLYLDYLEAVRALNAKLEKAKRIATLKKDILLDAFEEFREIMALNAVKSKAISLKCSSENLAPIEEYIEAITGKREPLCVAVIAHWIWMVKRKLMGLGVLDHIMPVLYGTQGSGKSTAVERLCDILSDWRLDLKIDAITDSRNFFAFEENYIVVFDELQNAAKSDIDTLKNTITTKEVVGRRMRTNIVDRIKQNTSFIGTTNRPLNEQIFDTTGMRRFFQLQTLDECNQKVINSIDYTSLWLGVDENKADGYLKPFASDLKAHQQTLTANDTIELFITAFDLKLPVDPNVKSSTVTPEELYETYYSWAKRNGYNKPSNSDWFYKQLSNRGVKSERQTVDKKQQRLYSVTEESRLKLRSFPNMEIR